MSTDITLEELFQGEALDHKQPIVLYEQVKRILVGVINRNKIKPGEQMPGERELEEYFQVSRITIRRALSEMVASGYLQREAGRGTFVLRSVIHDSANIRRGSLMDVLRSEGEKVSSAILALRWEQPPADVAKALESAPQGRVLRMSRLVMMDAAPAYLAHNWLNVPEPAEIHVVHELLDRVNIWDMLVQLYGITPDSAEQTLQALAANHEEAEQLKVLEGTPLMLIELLVRDASNRPIGYVKVAHIGSLYKFHQVLGHFEWQVSGIPSSVPSRSSALPAELKKATANTNH